MKKQIVVVPYDQEWPKIFEGEAHKIKDVLGDNCVAIHHVGSTAVPGLSAKPVIDMIGIIKNPDSAIQALTTLGFAYKGEYNIPMRYYFNRSEGVAANLHCYEEGHPEIELNLCFRNYLRNHSEARDEYRKLKEDLLKNESSYEKKNSLFTGYNLGKDAFIRDILQKAHFNRIRIMKCTHYVERDAVKKLRHDHMLPVDGDFMDKPDHYYLMLYKGVEIAGYAQIEFLSDQRAVFQVFLLDDQYRGQGLEKQFLTLCNQWLKKQEKIVW